MKLSKIKIAGFKSFVDPTSIELPSKLVAIVGPNGCGKSNIIDAVTWVMGESSPKYLRGQSLTDVIFNGSNGRKPVGQASVELIFDNSDGTIGGEYAQYSEISVKRMINRDSDSGYFLNGSRCRKKDIVDIFLGTGLGPRSYSIIGQNMITRIVEAKPDDLRKYLEEAAGISKYKERRHETELRIRHTNENLARVNDLRTELEKQLNHLQHQAKVAEKYKVLKEQERTFKAELYAVEWRELDSKMVTHTLQIQQEETALEARKSELSGAELEIENMRDEQRAVNESMQEVQRRYYAIGNEITRVEQDILHHEEKQSQWQNDLKQTEADWQMVKDQLGEAEEQLEELETTIQEIEPEFDGADQQAELAKDKLNEAEDSVHELQTQWDDFNQASAKTTQTEQVEKTQIQHLEQRITFLRNRQEQLQNDQSRLNFTELSQEIDSFGEKAQEAAAQLEEHKEELHGARQEIQQLQTLKAEASKSLDEIRSELQRMRGQQASLEALQQTALGKNNNAGTEWVKQNSLSGNPRLAQQISVAKGWEQAVEKILGFCLQAICVDDLSQAASKASRFKDGNLCLFSKKASKGAVKASIQAETLLQKIETTLPLDAMLSGIYVADSYDEAERLCDKIAAHESVVTKDGIWLNPAWVKILREEDPAAGIFAREQELKALEKKIAEAESKKEALEEKVTECDDKATLLEGKLESLQQAFSQKQSAAAQLNGQYKAKQERLIELKSQSERLIKDQNDCVSELEKAEEAIDLAKTSWEQAVTKLDSITDTRDELIAKRDQARAALQKAREQANEAKEIKHDLEMRLQNAKSQKGNVMQNIGRMQSHMASLNERKISLQTELSAMAPIETLKQTLERSVEKHAHVESELNKARIAVESLDEEYRHLENKRHTVDKELNKTRTKLETLRLEAQGWKVKADTLLEKVAETEIKLEDVLQTLPEDVSVDEWRSKLETVVKRIDRLGPINLVAIEEYATCLERKEYLDKQVEDLEAGLQTLENAIAKIDRETKQRFKETFEKVNERFKELFPTVFGGGKAYLDLTGDDLLEAGVTMMACPPGKRNSSIHLLSGGEKSLTAIALIFSIFHLNPAPFCLLDEVDAALDDANVIRFTKLVKKMADNTQFLFISHNKLTIEIGHHLVGVTMHEPGVSRLVSVDMEKAISLAEQ